jgi:hypothetical protein
MEGFVSADWPSEYVATDLNPLIRRLNLDGKSAPPGCGTGHCGRDHDLIPCLPSNFTVLA